MHSPLRPATHLDWADEAESAQRGQAWPQAAALWRKALKLCDDPERRGGYQKAIADCESQIAINERLADIARRILGIPTLQTQNADYLDFHEVAVWSLKEALRAAYRLDRDPQ